MNKIIKLIYLVIVFCLILTSCANVDENSSEIINSSTTSSDKNTSTTASQTTTAQTTTPPNTTTVTTGSSSVISSSSSSSSSNDGSAFNPDNTTTKKPITTTKKPITTTKKPITTTKKPITTTKPPVVIPTIKTPTSSGKTVFSYSSTTVDVSNKSQGYITAKYFGDNLKVKIQISKDGFKYNYDLNSNGKYEVYPLQMGNGTYTIKVLENISGTKYATILSEEISVSLVSANIVFLYPNQFINFSQGSNVVKKSAEVCAGKTNDFDKIAAIFKYVTELLSYDDYKASTVQSGYLPDVDKIISTKKGICFDYAAVFAAMCRAQGIPTKLVTGYTPDGQYHAWNQVYTEKTGWINADIYLKVKGFNLVDATFYSSATNKKDIAKYIANSSNYKILYIY